MNRLGRLLGAALLVTGAIVAPVAVGTAAQADAPATPVAAPFDAPLCENTVGNPAVDADGGPVANLLSVFGQRLTDYNDGKPVILYNNSGRSGWTSSGSQYSANPLCATRYVEEAGGPVSSWMYCTYDRASTCGWTNENGELERNGVVLPGLEYLDPDNRLTEDQQKLQSYIIQNDIPVVAGPNGTGGTVAADTVANNDTPSSRSLRQNLVHCIDNPGKSSALEFCENNMSAETQARILELIGSDSTAMLSATASSATVVPGAEGEVVVSTTLAGIPLDVTLTGGTATVCEGPATLTGGVLVVDEDAELPAEITLCVTRADAGDVSVSVSGTPPVIENLGFFQSKRYEGDNLCQIFSAVEAERQTTLNADATVAFEGAPPEEPTSNFTIVKRVVGDAAHLVGSEREFTVEANWGDDESVQFTVQNDGDIIVSPDLPQGTPITLSEKEIPEIPGVVWGEYVLDCVSSGDEGAPLLRSLPASGTPAVLTLDHNVNQHCVLTNTANTPPESPEPVIGTSLVDSADGDRELAWNGGTVIDTVAYQNLNPGTEYTVTGELMLKSDGSATGITGSTTFTPTEANGSVDVTFTVPAGFDGEVLVAFEQLFEGDEATGEPVAVHEDIDDAAQTVTVEEAPVVEEPVIGTSLVDSADQDHALGWNGGTVIDTVAYQNLVPGTEYTVTGELMNKADGSATGITGSTTFTPTEANGSVDVTFVVPTGFAGEVLVAFEQLFEGDEATGEPVAVHEDIDDAAQTVTVEEAPVVEEPVIGTSLVDAADQDHVLTAKGGKLIDTVAYRNLVPGTEHTVTGELMNKADGSATGIKGSTTFTAAEANGTVDVEFTVPAGFDGEVLVAFEHLFEGAEATGEPVAEHTDINDAAQTVSVSKPGTEKPSGPNNEHLSTTGGTLPWIGAGVAGLLLVAGASLLVARRRQAASNVES